MEEKAKNKLILPNIIKMNKYKKILNNILQEKETINSNYCLIIKLSSQNQLIIEIYSEENPTNKHFKSTLTLKELNKFHSYFKSYNNINEAYESINDIIKKDNYDMGFEGNQNSIINLILIVNNEQIKISLNEEKIPFIQNDLELNEFINLLYNEILNLKEKYNILIIEKNEEINKIKEEKKVLKNRLKEIKEENGIMNNKINNLKKEINEIKQANNIGKKSSKNYPKKEELINQSNTNQNQIINNNETYDYQNNQNINNNLFYNYMIPYYNNDLYNYHSNYITHNNNQFENINDMNDYGYFFDENGTYDSKDNDEEDEKESDDINNIIYNHPEEKYNDLFNYNAYNNFYSPNHVDTFQIEPYQNHFDYNINNINQIEYVNKNNISNAEKKEEKKIEKLSINDFNKKYGTQYKDNKIKKLELGTKKIGNDFFEDLPRYEFNNLLKLYIVDNNISNIDNLITLNNLKLEKLYLSHNKISDISILSKVKLEKLQRLYLDNNIISDINVLSKVNFPLLTTLSIHHNQIKDISVLEKVNFKELLNLSLNFNNIDDISVFKKVNFPQLKTLELNDNHIINIDCFDNIKNFNLELLYLNKNDNIDQKKCSKLISKLKEKIIDFQI